MRGVEFFRQSRSRWFKACNILLLCLTVSCTRAAEKLVEEVTKQEAEAVRDDCVADSLRLLQSLADRIAPLARASGPQELEETAIALGCTFNGQQLYCPTLGLLLHLEEREEGVTMVVQVTEPLRGIAGELSIRNDPTRGLVLAGQLHRFSPNGCEAILEFEELVALEAYGLPGGSLGMYFSAGAVEVTVLSPEDGPIAHGSAALSGRNALVVLNFDGLSLLDEVALD